jgi:hypothetical protein
MTQLVLIIANVFIFIICLVGMQSCYFRRRWLWFWLMLVCVLLSGACASIVLRQWMTGMSPQEIDLVHPPVNAL